ncbi:MAG: 5'/3'-nucleotidase SurE [Bacillota bacterium]|nr:5'/3'-nucleotidase SurE [Bacillota bacterium]
MKILLTNDDGIFSEGLRLLALELEKNHQVYVVAPDSEKSATSHAITIRNHLEIKKVQLEGLKNISYSVSGTPADCVRVGLALLHKDVDLVFSGINKGYNAGADIKYSGTVSACAEANLHGLSGVAVSTQFKEGSSDFKTAASFVPGIFSKYKDLVLGQPMVLNINIPKLAEEEIKGIKVCELGDLIHDRFRQEIISEEISHVFLKDRKPIDLKDGADQKLLSQGYITVTPIKYIYKDQDLMNKFLAVK